MLTWSELRPILFALRRWWWVIVLSTGLAGSAAFALSLRELRYYTSHVTLKIGTPFDAPLPDRSQIEITSQLSGYYAEIATRPVILDQVVSKLGLSFSGDYIRLNMMEIRQVQNAGLLEIYITDSNPIRGAAIANAIGEELAAISPNSPEKVAAEQKAIADQIVGTNTLIKDLEQRRIDLDTRYKQATSASEQRELEAQISELEKSLSREKEQYNSLLLLKNSTVANSLLLFERAQPASSPLPSRRVVTIAIASIVGLVLALITIFALEKVDLRWNSKSDVEVRLQLPSLGEVPIGPPLLTAQGVYAQQRLQAVHDVQTQILLKTAEIKLRTIMVSSPNPDQARSAFTLDLAHLFANSGYRVILVDAELTNATVTRMLVNATPIPPVSEAPGNSDIWTHLRSTAIPNLTLLPGRTEEILGLPTLVPSLRWGEIVERLRDLADLVIFDGPAALIGADTALLAPHLDAVAVTLVPSTDTRDIVEQARERLLNSKQTNLIGAITLAERKVEKAFPQLPMLPKALLALPAGTPPAAAESPTSPSVIITPSEVEPAIPPVDTAREVIDIEAIESVHFDEQEAEIAADATSAQAQAPELNGQHAHIESATTHQAAQAPADTKRPSSATAPKRRSQRSRTQV
jgi:polysaccharide biosynthesis transport protein